MEAKKLFAVVGTDARQAAAGRVLPCRVRLPWMVIVCMSGAS